MWSGTALWSWSLLVFNVNREIHYLKLAPLWKFHVTSVFLCVTLLLSAFPLLSWGNLWSLQKHLIADHSNRQQTHTLPHWNSLTQELKALVHNRLKYKHVFSPFISPHASLRKPYVIKFWEATQSTAGGLFNWPSWGVAEVGFKRYWPYGFG